MQDQRATVIEAKEVASRSSRRLPQRRNGLKAMRTCLLVFGYAFCIHLSAATAHANPTQEEVFKSISSNVDDKLDGRKVLGVVAAATGGIILLVLLNNRQQRVDVPKVTNHQGKLMRELMKTAGLKASQIRQLKALSADLAEKNQSVENLVTLLLCPSLIKKARDRNTPGK